MTIPEVRRAEVKYSQPGARAYHVALGQHFREKRKALGMTMKEVAAHGGISITAVHRLEMGKPVYHWTVVRVKSVFREIQRIAHTEMRALSD